MYHLNFLKHLLRNIAIWTESVATLPPFSPIEGRKWFDQIFSQWESQKNRFALIYFGKIQFLPPCIWNLPFMSTASGHRIPTDKKNWKIVPTLYGIWENLKGTGRRLQTVISNERFPSFLSKCFVTLRLVLFWRTSVWWPERRGWPRYTLLWAVQTCLCRFINTQDGALRAPSPPIAAVLLLSQSQCK